MSYRTIIFLFSLFSTCIICQDCCDDDTRLILCYTSTDDYCIFSNCNYTFDGNNMRGIRQKLYNSQLFGDSGVVPCAVTPLPLRNINSVKDIEDQKCDIILIGNFAADNNAGFGTTLSTSLLLTIREWSLECKENLVILFQGESKIWGYEVENDNANPNLPNGNDTLNIFDGPFGQLTEFDQGGSFQANFSQLASTGAEVLSVDNFGRPTIVLDNETNDIIMSDVGIICNTAGLVTNSPNISNSNDILACNIFALGCQIADNSFIKDEKITICQGQSYQLPDGRNVMTTGLYTSDLLTINGCDSIINTTLEVEGQINEYRNYQGCQNDGYTETIGTTEYNETNTSGEERLLTTAGCDSVVVVDFVYESPSYYETDTSFCSEDEFYLFGKLVSGDTTISDVVVNAKGCDSTITYYVERIDFPDLEVETTVEIINNETYTFRNNIPSDLNVEWYPISGLSCADCPNPALTNIENISEYTLTVSDDGGCQIQYLINIEYTCDIYYPNIISLQDKDRGFQVLSSCRLNNFELSIYDRWGAPVFRSINQDEIWFGNRKNKAVEQGVYLYILKYIDPSNQTIVETGDITVVR